MFEKSPIYVWDQWLFFFFVAALNEALNGEVQRLKLAIGESSHSNEADRSKMQSLNAEMFQQLNISQLRQQQPQSQSLQNGTVSTKPESNE